MSNEEQNGNLAKPMLAVRAFSIEVVSDNPAEGLLSKETVSEKDIEKYLSTKVPNCNVDLKRIYTDDRCRYFQHYMPTNKTTAKHSYKENHKLHKSGNFVKLYISQVFAWPLTPVYAQVLVQRCWFENNYK